MGRTHYEEMLYGGYFPLKEYFELLKKELPVEGFDWERFVETEAISNLPKIMDTQGYPPQDISLAAHILFHQYSYYIGSGRTYEVTGGIAKMLINTKLDIDTYLLKSPFREIILVPPPGLLKVYNKYTGWHEVYTIYVNLDEKSDTDKLLRVLVVGRANEKSANKYDDAAFFFKVKLGEGNVFDNLERYMAEWEKDPIQPLFKTENDTEIMPRIFQFVLNVLLYLTSQDSDIRVEESQYKEMEKRLAGLKNPAKIRKVQQRMEKAPRGQRYIVGSSIHLTTEEQKIYESTATGKIQWPVGGHWRKQWYGPLGSQYQRQKWIRPYIKGSELADLIKSVGVIK
jgi:hypothetical protein